ncbi:hypothetical protein [Sphingomonas sp. IC081]|uniref:hypothetical protein n=1 Tax=Sphingomonas sp. IC081 TaxID=304378 RepID=UPI001159D565|nr:hypothetical protein [Sphingomonas sp. IC081]QDK31768.1 hypothetical protein DM450_02980 [Sphingomonas sp. IC081]
MDFTYILAAFLSLCVGFGSALVFVAVRGTSPRKLVAIAVVLAVVADLVLLIDWRGIGELGAANLLADFGFFILYGCIGCAFGAYPVLVLRSVLRRARRAGREDR